MNDKIIMAPREIAPAGHPPAHEPQLTQESEITYAIIVTSYVYYSVIIIRRYKNIKKHLFQKI
mgnify:CR=1 FL=1